MAIFQSNPDQTDHLSSLSDALLITIISLLPTYIAARTSVLSRRFRHLWKNSPSVDLSTKCIPDGQFKHSTYAAMANSSLLSRTSSNSLLRLHLDLGYLSNSSFFCSLLVHAHALGLRHLTIDGYWGIVEFELLLGFVSDDPFPVLLEPGKEVSTFPNLKNLDISICFHECNFEAVVMMLHHSTALESLELQHKTSDMLGVKRAKRIAWRSMLPCNSDGSNRYVCLKNLHLGENREEFNKLLNKKCTPMRQRVSDYPFPVLLEPGKEVPTFPNLKHLDMSMCFHKCNFETVVTMLHHCTTLESLKLHHKSTDMLGVKRGKRNAWRSMLPRNSDGNNQYACFKNLHFGENRKEFKKLLNKKCTPKRQRLSDYPFSVLMEPGKRVPTFPNVKHLDVSVCLHEYNSEAMVTMLHHSTALESLELHHKQLGFNWDKG
ncbi:F-box/LRR-repeat protein [Carex littledalei]|uniref:F-box/LRR-repeat protein n=1 Tax=Carex littledalei TaxID=544730 RepID=A0A833QYY6_9POAL|nr:F-box/LRR-repeat protein [Carex littledalei]